jgi:microcystin-dependent protein
MTVPNFAFFSGDPDNLVGGNAAAMTDIQGPLYDRRQFLNTVLLPSLNATVSGSFVPGDIKPTCAATVQDGWLLCNGSSVLRIDYPNLFNALGGASSPYGLPDGSHFNLPDLRGRIPVGADTTGVRLAANRNLGNGSGAETHPLTLTQMPAHSHGNAVDSGGFVTAGIAGTALGFDSATGANRLRSVGATDTQGAGTAHNNMQPYQVVNWLVKT